MIRDEDEQDDAVDTQMGESVVSDVENVEGAAMDEDLEQDFDDDADDADDDDDEDADDDAEQPSASEQAVDLDGPNPRAAAPSVGLQTLPVTGEPRVDDALARLTDLSSLPVDEHVGVFEDVQRRLHDTLADLSGQ